MLVCSGFIKPFKIFHQSFGPVSELFNLSEMKAYLFETVLTYVILM